MRKINRFWIWILLGVVVLSSCTYPWERTADLRAVVSDVNRYSTREAKSYPVQVGSSQKLIKGDGVNVDQRGTANLEMGGCTLRIYRSSGLQVTGLPSSSAPVCTVYFQQGTIYNRVSRKMIINTDWVVIETVGTEFIVHLDPDREVVWVVVVEDDVAVTAAGDTVLVEEGQQTWVWRGQPPEQPRPATRDEIVDLFPPLEDLTNGELSDDGIIVPTGGEDFPPEVSLSFEPEVAVVNEEIFIQAVANDDEGILLTAILIDGQEVAVCEGPVCEFSTEFSEMGKHQIEALATDAADQTTSVVEVISVFSREDVQVVITTNTEEIIQGECPGPRTLEIRAEMPLAMVADYAVLWYQWEGIKAENMTMENLDGATFFAVLDGFDYCCGETTIELLVEAYGFEGEVISSGRKDVLMTYCIG